MTGERLRRALAVDAEIERRARSAAQASVEYAQSIIDHKEALERLAARAAHAAQEYGQIADAAADRAAHFRAMLQDLERGLCPCCGQPTGDNGRVSADLGGFGLLQ